MSSFIIEGGKKLAGEILPQGAKNEALEVISATILTSEPVVIKNVPDILDVNNLIALMSKMGVRVMKLGEKEYRFQADKIDMDYLMSDEFVQRCAALRGSILLLGPLLGRFRKAYIAKPGGDQIGRRRLDTHFIGVQKLGAKLNHDFSRNVYEISADDLHGTYMLLDEASVTGTANIIMAAVLAKGKTTVYNAACEPYIQQLCHMLNAMGAKISGISSNLLTIEGVEEPFGNVQLFQNDFTAFFDFGFDFTAFLVVFDLFGRSGSSVFELDFGSQIPTFPQVVVECENGSG